MAVGNPDLSNSTRSQPSEKTVHLYVFGDSLSDSGNVAALVANISTSSVFCNGRYGDGPVWHDYLEHVLNGTHHGHLFTGCEHVVSIGKGKEGENKEACQSGGRDSNLDIKITVSGEYDLLKAERCHAFDCAGGSRSATATQPDGIADCTMCSRASATNNENCASVKHRDTTVTHEYHISSENTSTPPAGGRVSPRPSERTRHAHAAELLTGHTSDTRIDESGVNEVTAFAVHDNVLNRFGNNPGGNNARYEHLSDVEWEHIIEDDIECDAMQYGTEYSTDTITHVSVYDDSLAKPSPRGEMLITTLAINETECAYTVKVHNYAHGGSTTCNDAQQGFATYVNPVAMCACCVYMLIP
ncbi:hypothetical protein SARC_04216 [Sphaeroforma arctica JP610]|uniref:Uncharacterized protein n=1 Tax=Sphaeroforma arctica JP610 TaxID=667725 RepID=A0A0L0G5L9_9EUKA|nr:hypothetical protein SARC_04216 [Sphaeroforma arctica JP610]KNC83543.1 hypothetical protein SARC_04216 [Sphaeroforma arctica JP610]|eukprot:XP_014157445.1 hypothetical protein SARC_04216 [Sphaeroforma arctica JP610]